MTAPLSRVGRPLCAPTTTPDPAALVPLLSLNDQSPTTRSVYDGFARAGWNELDDGSARFVPALSEPDPCRPTSHSCSYRPRCATSSGETLSLNPSSARALRATGVMWRASWDTAPVGQRCCQCPPYTLAVVVSRHRGGQSGRMGEIVRHSRTHTHHGHTPLPQPQSAPTNYIPRDPCGRAACYSPAREHPIERALLLAQNSRSARLPTRIEGCGYILLEAVSGRGEWTTVPCARGCLVGVDGGAQGLEGYRVACDHERGSGAKLPRRGRRRDDDEASHPRPVARAPTKLLAVLSLPLDSYFLRSPPLTTLFCTFATTPYLLPRDYLYCYYAFGIRILLLFLREIRDFGACPDLEAQPVAIAILTTLFTLAAHSSLQSSLMNKNMVETRHSPADTRNASEKLSLNGSSTIVRLLKTNDSPLDSQIALIRDIIPELAPMRDEISSRAILSAVPGVDL
ncbi:hypothetical protein C8R45DRAFT_1090302 [Mycena sanguinolenta]|nr:hypothetical protein C8R45DRAFT_1090302 [Mycena sanguinolenta]